MAYQEHGMQEILEVLRRAHLGHAKATIARVTGRGRRTVRRWLEVAAELGWTASTEPDEALAVAVLERCRPGRPSEAGETAELLARHRDKLLVWLRPTEEYHRRVHGETGATPNGAGIAARSPGDGSSWRKAPAGCIACVSAWLRHAARPQRRGARHHRGLPRPRQQCHDLHLHKAGARGPVVGGARRSRPAS